MQVIIPLLFFLCIDFKKTTLKNLYHLIKISILSFLIGPLLYLIYVFILTGSFFKTTYSSIDQTSLSNYENLKTNFYFYISLGNSWFLIQLLSLMILTIFLVLKFTKLKIYFVLFFSIILNYFFY